MSERGSGVLWYITEVAKKFTANHIANHTSVMCFIVVSNVSKTGK